MDNFFLGTLLGFLLGGIGTLLVLIDDYEETQATAIENGCAVYHPKTGEFTWKNEWNKGQ